MTCTAYTSHWVGDMLISVRPYPSCLQFHSAHLAVTAPSTSTILNGLYYMHKPHTPTHTHTPTRKGTTWVCVRVCLFASNATHVDRCWCTWHPRLWFGEAKVSRRCGSQLDVGGGVISSHLYPFGVLINFRPPSAKCRFFCLLLFVGRLLYHFTLFAVRIIPRINHTVQLWFGARSFAIFVFYMERILWTIYLLMNNVVIDNSYAVFLYMDL